MYSKYFGQKNDLYNQRPDETTNDLAPNFKFKNFFHNGRTTQVHDTETYSSNIIERSQGKDITDSGAEILDSLQHDQLMDAKNAEGSYDLFNFDISNPIDFTDTHFFESNPMKLVFFGAVLAGGYWLYSRS